MVFRLMATSKSGFISPPFSKNQRRVVLVVGKSGSKLAFTNLYSPSWKAVWMAGGGSTLPWRLTWPSGT